MKRLLSLLFCLIFFAGFAIAEAEQTTDPASLVFGAADSVGDVVNINPDDFSPEKQDSSPSVPLDVVLVLDVSGSMSTANSSNGKQLISYAQDAAISFCSTLLSLNPESRVAVVTFETNVNTILGLTDISEFNYIASTIRGLGVGGMTNTGGGYARANDILGTLGDSGRQKVVLMLTDGIANEGSGDPLQYAIDQGTIASRQGLVYTVGLVGGMSESDKNYTRKVLNSGYETRYFEVDFEKDVGDISVQLASAFVSIAVGSSIAPEKEFYRLWVDGLMDVRVQNGSVEHLSSAPEDSCSSASFGSISLLGDEMDQKLIMLRPGNYIIRTHGITTGTSMLQLYGITANGARERTLINRYFDTNPAHCLIILIIDGEVQIIDVSYEPLDLTAVDPFTGKPTHGSELAGTGKTGASVDVMGSPDKKSVKIDKLAAKTTVDVLAVDEATKSWFIGYINKNGLYARGWLPKDNLKNVTGYIPTMIWITPGIEMTVSGTVQAMRAPGSECAPGDKITSGTKVTVRHAERDTKGNEWAYVETTNKKGATLLSYIPAESIDGWTPLSPENFMIAYGMPRLMWQMTVGENKFTEVMWAASQTDGSGVVLSGRTSSTKGVLKAKYKDRDSFAMLIAPDGTVENAVTQGGNGWDSYHCILPDANGYYVAGVTRSNDKDFDDIWDPSSHKCGNQPATTKKTNALIGHLDEDLRIDWLTSFGVGSVSYGFDMILKLSDGTIAGEGWLTDSSDGTQRSYGAQDFYVVKLSPSGQVIARNSYGWSGNDVPDSGVATPDGGMILVGSTHRSSTDTDGLILVINQNLDLVSHVTYGGWGKDNFDNIRQMPDGTYLVTGYTQSSKTGSLDFWAMNIDSLGRCIWTKTYGGSGDDELCGTTVLEDGRCILVGKTYSTDGHVTGSTATGKQCDAWAICIDTNGRILWRYTAGGSSNDYFNSAALDESDGGIVLAGICDNSAAEKGLGFVIKIKPAGN